MRSWTSGFFLLRPAALVAGAWFGQANAVLATGPDPAIDDFERPSLGTNWTRLGGSSAEIVNGHDLGVPNTVGCAVSWSASTFLADQFSETVLAQDKPPNMLTQVYVRMRSTDRARYGFHFNGDPGNSRWEIKFDGVPTAQTRILASVPGLPPVPGDTVRIEAYGSTIRGYLNGQVLLTSVDTAPERITTTGPAGVVARNAQGTTNTPPTPIFASRQGGSLDPDG